MNVGNACFAAFFALEEVEDDEDDDVEAGTLLTGLTLLEAFGDGGFLIAGEFLLGEFLAGGVLRLVLGFPPSHCIRQYAAMHNSTMVFFPIILMNFQSSPTDSQIPLHLFTTPNLLHILRSCTQSMNIRPAIEPPLLNLNSN